jgi:hypothetical protein
MGDMVDIFSLLSMFLRTLGETRPVDAWDLGKSESSEVGRGRAEKWRDRSDEEAKRRETDTLSKEASIRVVRLLEKEKEEEKRQKDHPLTKIPTLQTKSRNFLKRK